MDFETVVLAIVPNAMRSALILTLDVLCLRKMAEFMRQHCFEFRQVEGVNQSQADQKVFPDR